MYSNTLKSYLNMVNVLIFNFITATTHTKYLSSSFTLVQVCRECCCHAQMSLYLYKHECCRKPLICFEQVSLNGIIINS